MYFVIQLHSYTVTQLHSMMINNLVKQVQSQLLSSDDAEQFQQYMKTLDTSNRSRKELLKQLNKIYETEQYSKSDLSRIYSPRVLEDLDFYDSKGKSVFDVINLTETCFGDKHIRKLLATPQDDVTLLKERQLKIKQILDNTELYSTLKSHLEKIKRTESTLLWFWNPPTQETTQLHEMIYYNMPTLEFVNENTLFMQLSNLYAIFAVPSITTLSPIVTIILPYIFLRVMGADISMSSIYEGLTKQITKMATKFSIGSADKPSPFIKYLSIAMWVIFYLQSAYTSIMSAYNTHKIISNIHTKSNTIASFINEHTEVINILTKSGFKTDYLQSQCTLTPVFNHETFRTTPQLLTNKGIVLTSYYKLLKMKDQLIPAMQLIGEIDAYLTIVSLIKKHNYNLSEFIDQNSTLKPHIKIKHVYHPVIPNKKVITNSLDMTKKKPVNHIITGPNKAGKSTYIKSVIISLILSQTLTICNAKNAQITPFSYIDSYLNIPDCEGKESLYEAELNRCFEHMCKIKEFEDKSHRYMFTIMDEIFSSTNNKEGHAAAHAILKNMAKYDNSASIVTTHYYELANLEEETKNKIHNYKFTCQQSQQSEQNKTIFNYKISRGVSDQYIALKLLKDKGFDKDVIEDAYKVFNNNKTIKNTKNSCVSKKKK